MKEKNDEALYTAFIFWGLQEYINKRRLRKALNSKRGKNYRRLKSDQNGIESNVLCKVPSIDLTTISISLLNFLTFSKNLHQKYSDLY